MSEINHFNIASDRTESSMGLITLDTEHDEMTKFPSNDNINQLPYSNIYSEQTNEIFIPNKNIQVSITNDSSFFTIQFHHGNFKWEIKRRYKDIKKLHKSLRRFRTKLKFHMFSHASRVSINSAKNTVETDGVAAFSSSSLPKLPNKQDIDHTRELENYLEDVLNNESFRSQNSLMKFMEISKFSFIAGLGGKGREMMIKMRAGRLRYLLCCHKACACWQDRWLFVKETYIGLVHPKHGTITNVLLIDRGFKTLLDKNDLKIITNSHTLVLKYPNDAIACEWNEYLINIATASDFTSVNPHNSFAPVRNSVQAAWFVDGSDYMNAVADALENAQEEIFIADWWLSPEIYLKRHTVDQEDWRLDRVLLRKAELGIKIFILLYKEFSLALGLNSYYSKEILETHENIKVLRHPDHFRSGVFSWAHHEKLVVVDQSYAFVGGIDLAHGRWDDHRHLLTDLGGVSLNAKSRVRRDVVETDGVSEIEDEIKLPKKNTPEMKRRGLMKRVTETGRSVWARFRHSTDAGRVACDAVMFNAGDHGLRGERKLWMGKDYANFIFKDFGELTEPFTDLVDRFKVPRMAWHDIASCVIGSPARDVARHFIERWNACKYEKIRDDSTYPYLLPKSYNEISAHKNIFKESQVNFETVDVQVLRSVSNWSAGYDNYSERSIQNAYVETIEQAENFIYIENQFFISLDSTDVSNRIGDSLVKRILRAYNEEKMFRVYVILPLLPGFEGEIDSSSGNALRAVSHWNYSSICRGDNSLLSRLRKNGIENPSEYITFHGLRNHSTLHSSPITELIYVHSKLMIVDDKKVIIGSANINDRSLHGDRDSEMAVLVTDESGNFGGKLRRKLFKEHLGLLDKNDKNININDPIKDEFYKEIWQKISRENTEIFDEVFKCIPHDSIKNISMVKEYNDEPFYSKLDDEEAKTKLKNIQGFLVDFPLNFLCDEDLVPSITTKEGIVWTYIWT